MEKVTRQYITKETIYIAKNGKEFTNELECTIYEKYCDIPLKDLLSPYMVFKKWSDNPLKEDFNICLVKEELPSNLIAYLRIIEKDDVFGFAYCYRDNYAFHGEPFLMYYDCHGAYSGGDRPKQWIFWGTEDSLNLEIKKAQEKLKYFSSLKNGD